MLSISGSKSARFCDGVSRRGFLRMGALGLGGIALPQVLKAEAHQTVKSSKAVIMIFLPGGPPHQDMWDLKMDAPAEIRGEFNPIKTNVPGIEICELFPKMAAMMDRFSIIRSIVGATGDHASDQCLTGKTRQNAPAGGGWPSIGSVVSKLHGQAKPGMPPFVGLSPKMGHVPWSDPGKPGFLGPAHSPFQPNGGGASDLVLNNITLDRLNDRKALLASFDNLRRDVDASGMMQAM